jgi:hypothetical protein
VRIAIPILYFVASYGGSKTCWSLQGILLLSLGSLSVHALFIYFILLFYETRIWKEIDSMLFPNIPFSQYTYTFASYCLFCVFYAHSIPKCFTVTICNVVSWQHQNLDFSRIYKIILFIYQQLFRILSASLFWVILRFLNETSFQLYKVYKVDLEPYHNESWVRTNLQTDNCDPFYTNTRSNDETTTAKPLARMDVKQPEIRKSNP